MRIYRFLISLCLFVSTAVLANGVSTTPMTEPPSTSYQQSQPSMEQKPVVCENKYALCSAAACQPIPGQPGKVLCKCSVWDGKNVGYSQCMTRKPRNAAPGVKALISTFSFGGFHYKVLSCPSNVPWASCLDQPCLTDKNDPRFAYCTCKIVRGQPFVTFAGECQKASCDARVWSGATASGNRTLVQALTPYFDKRKVESINCPIQ